MSSIKKRQHYVWRSYLKPWSDKEHIWTYFKESGKIEYPALMGVAQEKYFYKLEDFTEEEEDFLKKFIDHLSPPALKEVNQDFFLMFTSTGKLKKQLEQAKNPLIDRNHIAEEIRKPEINLMEDAHCKMENLGTKLIHYRSLEELKTIAEDDYIFDAMMFLCFQYFRTKNMRKAVLKNVDGGKHEQLMEKAWNIISFPLGTILARSISLDSRLKFIFIENNTTNHFVTGDQPVFNVLNDQLNEKGEVAELEFYFPLTPKHALNIHFRSDQADQFVNKQADATLIDYLNKKVVDNSDYFVFADNKEQLEKLK
jgi:hypothetical protein